ncbi:coiled-coil and C2 domain-containing protein 1B isoform X2 [Kryptolebias marmoratus]|uniref:coiled-coil and C2 domain-containing protein 1B isoform X2 n=1 Tax=Kryptolebias marmoratus TaxID=37003 RepID=UPI0007F8F414|nr:coiled-coil and C2 domain-containing protein 1B isoform X2 [Kryptolebias marmoratus]
MFGKKKKAPAAPKGQGAAAAKQMGLFVDMMDPEEMMMGAGEDDPDLEAELAAITGSKAGGGGRVKQKGPLPMEDITKMADECMRDVDEDDEDYVEDDEDLLVELQEVVGEEEAEDEVAASPTLSASSAETPKSPAAAQVQNAAALCQQTRPEEVKSSATAAAAPGSLQSTLEERVVMYRTALKNAKTAGETSKSRRYDRGLKTLESMLAALKKGKPVNESEIPPPVAAGAQSAVPQPAAPVRPAPPPPEPEAATPPSDAVTPSGEEERPEGTADLPNRVDAKEATKTMLLERQKEYKMSALRAKKQGDMERAKLDFLTSKKFDAVIEALEKGEPVDLSGLPPSPGRGGSAVAAEDQPRPAAPAPAASSAPSAPKDALEALEQRRAKYAEASAQAKAAGDDRKARMHDRIAKQYQSAIRAHKAGRGVNFEELPVPPGFPPIPGQKAPAAEQGFAAALEAANKLASTDAAAAGNEEEEESKLVVPEKPKLLDVSAAELELIRSPAAAAPDRTPQEEELSPTAVQQLELLESRKKQYLKAALQAKQKSDMDQAKTFLRTAKGLDAMIEAARGGRPVDVSALPSPPGDEDDDFILVHHSDVQMSDKAEKVYTQLANILKEQHEKCLTHSKQFMHLGNISETTRFEEMAESCKKSMEVLKLAQSRALPPPKHHFEEKSFRTVRIFPDLSSTDLLVIIVKGMNLPAPSGIQADDLDAYIKFDFPYPSAEQPQKHKTSVIKNTNSPEFNQSFKLSINRNHRGLRRVVASKGLKLELLHKGGFLRSDKPIGTALVKLDKLESQSEIREIVEVMEGRKHTGGRVEVKVRLREPLSGQDVQASTERWLVLDS